MASVCRFKESFSLRGVHDLHCIPNEAKLLKLHPLLGSNDGQQRLLLILDA